MAMCRVVPAVFQHTFRIGAASMMGQLGYEDEEIKSFVAGAAGLLRAT
jgi:hypothetical protein